MFGKKSKDPKKTGNQSEAPEVDYSNIMQIEKDENSISREINQEKIDRLDLETIDVDKKV